MNIEEKNNQDCIRGHRLNKPLVFDDLSAYIRVKAFLDDFSKNDEFQFLFNIDKDDIVADNREWRKENPNEIYFTNRNNTTE